MPIKKKCAFYQGIPFLNLTKNCTNCHKFYGLSQSNYPIFLRIRTIKNSCFSCQFVKFVCSFLFCESGLFLSRTPVFCECCLLGLSCGKIAGRLREGCGKVALSLVVFLLSKTVLDNVFSRAEPIDMFCFISLRKKHSN